MTALREHLLARLRSQRGQFLAFWLMIAVLAAVSILPVWRGRFLPLLDEPNHAASVFVWLEIDNPAARLQEFYEVQPAFAPYLLQYGLSYLFGLLAGAEAGHKLALSVYVIALPAAALLWCKRTRRSPWLAVLTFPLAYNYSWSYGFHPFDFGAVAFLFAVVAFDAFLERPRLAMAAVAATLAMLCYLGHPLPLLALYVAVPVLWLSHGPRLKTALASVGMLAPSAAIVVYLSFTHGMAPGSASSGDQPFLDGERASLLELIESFPSFALDSVSGHGDVAVFWVIACVALAAAIGALLARRRSHQDSGGWREVLRRNRSAWLGLAMIGLYVGLPMHLSRPFYWWLVGPRFVFLAVFFLLTAPEVPERSPSRWFHALMAPGLAAALFLPILVAHKYAEFNVRAAPLVKMVAMTRSDANILFLSMSPRGDPAVNVHAWNQGASWVQMMHGGYSPAGFVHSIGGFPYARVMELPSPPWDYAEIFDASTESWPYDYILVRNQPVAIFGDTDPEFHLMALEGEFALYERHARLEPPLSEFEESPPSLLDEIPVFGPERPAEEVEQDTPGR